MVEGVTGWLRGHSGHGFESDRYRSRPHNSCTVGGGRHPRTRMSTACDETAIEELLHRWCSLLHTSAPPLTSAMHLTGVHWPHHLRRITVRRPERGRAGGQPPAPRNRTTFRNRPLDSLRLGPRRGAGKGGRFAFRLRTTAQPSATVLQPFGTDSHVLDSGSGEGRAVSRATAQPSATVPQPTGLVRILT